MRLLEGRAVDHGFRIEDGDVGEHARLYEAAVGEADTLRCERRHLPHGELERHQLLPADVPAQNPRERAVGARMRAVLAERTVGRDATGVRVDPHPPLLERGAHIRLAHDEINRAGTRVIGYYDVEHV